MRSMISKSGLGLICLLAVPATVSAAEGTYMCAVTDVYECVEVAGCKRVSLDFANLAPVLKFDFDKKVMTSDDIGSDPREIALNNMEEMGDVLLFHGIGQNKESPRSFSAVISKKTGKIRAGITTADATLSLTGDCVDSF
ncbi:hypothetical protein [Methyloceanibacter stevinii]|nr:hypothetical protein [Methyloceanibacter stevinii]